MNRVIFALVFLSATLLAGYTIYAARSASLADGPRKRDFSLVIEGRRIVSGGSTIRVGQGDLVSLSVTADEEEEFHLHGYDRSVDLSPGISATLVFAATDSGRFLFELERSKTELGAVEVLPR